MRGVSCRLQPLLLEQEMFPDEIFEDTWEDKENELLPYLKNDVLLLFLLMLYTRIVRKNCQALV